MACLVLTIERRSARARATRHLLWWHMRGGILAPFHVVFDVRVRIEEDISCWHVYLVVGSASLESQGRFSGNEDEAARWRGQSDTSLEFVCGAFFTQLKVSFSGLLWSRAKDVRF